MATIDLQQIKKSYGNHPVVHGVDLSIANGEFVVVVGPSGCGKSTLLRMVAGLEAITSGTLLMNGQRMNDVEPKDRNIAMVFQNYALYPHMTVFDNMAYGLRIRGLSAGQIESRVNAAAKSLELSALLQRKPRELSGGQRQRVAMGRAIVREPEAFLFDEPLSNLDAKLRVQMRLEIKRLARESSTTSLFVTHDQVEAMTLADRIVVMNAGRVEQVGSPMDLYEQPATTFVASFIGSPGMNLLPATVEGATVKLPLADGALSLQLERANGVNKKVHVGVRPEHVSLAATADHSVVRMTLSVTAIEPLGADTLIYATTPLSGVAVPVVVRASGYHMHKVGDQLYAYVERKHLRCFVDGVAVALNN